MKSKKLIIGILGAIVGLVIIVYFLSKLFGISSLDVLGMCLPGSKPRVGLRRSCYVPSIYEGRTCYKKSDCEIGYCVLENKSDNKGICQDSPVGCVSVANEKGEFGEFGICFD